MTPHSHQITDSLLHKVKLIDTTGVNKCRNISFRQDFLYPKNGLGWGHLERFYGPHPAHGQ